MPPVPSPTDATGPAGHADLAAAAVQTPDAGRDPREPVEGLSYEQARDELVEGVRRLAAGGTTLEESLALWERGEALAATCQRWLDGARERLRGVTESADGGGGADDRAR